MCVKNKMQQQAATRKTINVSLNFFQDTEWLEDRAGDILYFSYCKVILWKDQKHQLIDPAIACVATA